MTKELFLSSNSISTLSANSSIFSGTFLTILVAARIAFFLI